MLGKDSVVLLVDYPTSVGVIIIGYYFLLVLLGVGWLMQQVVALYRLKNEARMNELRRLQNQVNPHFFFNMLNNVYGMVDRDPEKTKALILKLADVMRYGIYEGDKAAVTIRDEIAYLEQYMELHRMRYHKSVEVRFTARVEKNIQVMPLLLIILVENAFKHGVERLRSSAYVHLTLAATATGLDFTVTNNFAADDRHGERGIGLQNLQKRLELGYPKRHHLQLTQTSNTYSVTLHLDI